VHNKSQQKFEKFLDNELWWQSLLCTKYQVEQALNRMVQGKLDHYFSVGQIFKISAQDFAKKLRLYTTRE
jgi:hypothetical protein